MCLAQEHNTVTLVSPPVRLEPAAPRSRVKHSTTELPKIAFTVEANTMNPDQTATNRSVWSGLGLNTTKQADKKADNTKVVNGDKKVNLISFEILRLRALITTSALDKFCDMSQRMIFPTMW